MGKKNKAKCMRKTEVRAEIIKTKTHICSTSTQKVSTLPYSDEGHGAHQCPKEESTLCSLFVFHPHKSGHKAVAVRGIRAESQGRRYTHTHQNTSSVLQTTVCEACVQVYVFISM